MATREFIDTVNRLTPAEQAAVMEFIQYLQHKPKQPEQSPFLSAVDEFIEQHPQLLERLAQ